MKKILLIGLVFLSISYAGEYTEQVKTQFSLIKLVHSQF